MEYPDSELVTAQRCKKACCFWIAAIIVILVGLMAAIVTLQVVYYSKDEQQQAKDSKLDRTTDRNFSDHYNITSLNDVTTEQGTIIRDIMTTFSSTYEIATQSDDATPVLTENLPIGLMPTAGNGESDNGQVMPMARPMNVGTTTETVPIVTAIPPPQDFQSGGVDQVTPPRGFEGRGERGERGGRAGGRMIPLAQIPATEPTSTKKAPILSTTTTTTSSTTTTATTTIASSTTVKLSSPSPTQQSSTPKNVTTDNSDNAKPNINVKIAILKLNEKQRIQDILVALILTLFGIGVICTICTVMIMKGVYKKERCRSCISCLECGRSRTANANESIASDSSQQLDPIDSSQENSPASQRTNDDRHLGSHPEIMETSFTAPFQGLPSYSEAISTPHLADDLPQIPLPPVRAQDGTLYTQVPHLHRSTSSLPSYEEACKTGDSVPKNSFYTQSLPSPRTRPSPAYIWPELAEESQQLQATEQSQQDNALGVHNASESNANRNHDNENLTALHEHSEISQSDDHINRGININSNSSSAEIPVPNINEGTHSGDANG